MRTQGERWSAGGTPSGMRSSNSLSLRTGSPPKTSFVTVNAQEFLKRQRSSSLLQAGGGRQAGYGLRSSWPAAGHASPAV